VRSRAISEQGRSTTLVCTSEAASILSRVVDETLEGPAEEYIYTDDEYSAFVDDETFAARPDHIKEINYFKEPRNGRVISTSTLISFCIFSYDEQQQLQARAAQRAASRPPLHAARAALACMASPRRPLHPPQASLPTPPGQTGSWAVLDDGTHYLVIVDGEVVATIDDYLASAIEDPPHILMPSRSSLHLNDEFITPDFGITVLGSADGFSPDGTTAGFVLWMRGRGILVDPPAHSAQYLHKNGISSRKVTP
jgi:hypothetical protein